MSTEEEFLLSIGVRIKRLRKSAGVSQVKLAELCDFDKSSLSRIETGKTNLTALTFKKIGDALNVKVGDFFKE